MKHFCKFDSMVYTIAQTSVEENGITCSEDINVIWRDCPLPLEETFKMNIPHREFINFYHGEYDPKITDDYIVDWYNTKIDNIKNSDIYCKHCGERLIEGANHSSESYESDICDTCMDKYYGYCDVCGNLFEYWDKMNESEVTGVICPKCHNKLHIKTLDLPVAYVDTIKSCLEIIKKHDLTDLIYGKFIHNSFYPEISKTAVNDNINEIIDNFCKEILDKNHKNCSIKIVIEKKEGV